MISPVFLIVHITRLTNIKKVINYSEIMFVWWLVC